MGVGYLHLPSGSVRFELALEQVGGHQVWVASLSADPSVRAIGVREDAAIEALHERLVAYTAAPPPSWSRQHRSASVGRS